MYNYSCCLEESGEIPGSFAISWEQRKVGDYYEFKNGLNKCKEFFGKGTPIVNFTDVFHKRGLIVSDLQGRVTLEQKEIDNFLVKKGDIFFTRTSETVEEIGYPSVMLESPENTVFSGFVLRGRTFLEQDPLEDVFKKYVFFTESFRKEMMSKSSMTTRALTSGTAIKNMVFYHPLSKEEQKKIGDYFSNLDNLITLHQRKQCILYIMEKILCGKSKQLGKSISWEQRKLGDVLDDMYNGQTPSRNKSGYWNGNIKWLSSGELNRGTVYDSIETITEDGQKSANLRIVPNGTFIMAITGLEAAGTRGNCALLGFDTTLNQSCMALFPKKDLLTSDFLFQWYRKIGEEYGLNYTQGTKQQSYNAELIKILPISLPSVTEQKKIASYLRNLDHLITLHQRKP